MFRGGDRIVKQQIAYKDFSSPEADALWDVSNMEEIGKGCPVCYKEGNDSTPAIVETHHATRYYYRLRNDSLLLTGYENNGVEMDYDQPILRLRFPLRQGDKVAGDYQGSGACGDRMAVRCHGHEETCVDARGRMVLPSGDTLCNVIRTHSIQLACEQYYRGKRHDGQVPTDSTTVVVDTYRWYAMGFRYPILETIATHLPTPAAGNPLYSVAYYYAPERQYYSDGDTENEQIRMATDNGLRQMGNDAPARELSPKDMHAVRFHQAPGQRDGVSAAYTLREVARVSCHVYTSNGAEVARSTTAAKPAGTYTENISLESLPPGVYTICLRIGEEAYTKKVTR